MHDIDDDDDDDDEMWKARKKKADGNNPRFLFDEPQPSDLRVFARQSPFVDHHDTCWIDENLKTIVRYSYQYFSFHNSLAVRPFSLNQ